MSKKNQIIREIDFRSFSPDYFSSILSCIFNSSQWKEIEDKRNKLCRSVFKPGANLNSLSIGIDAQNKKLSELLFDSMIVEYAKLDNARAGRRVSVGEYIDELPKTEENVKNCIEFYDKINMATMMADMLESLVLDANSALKKIDKNHVVTDFDAIESVLKPLREMSSLIHKDTHDKLRDMWTDFVDDVFENLSMKYKIFINKYTELSDELFKNGEIKNNLKHKLSK